MVGKQVNICFLSWKDLKYGNKIRMSREEVLRKHGELFALRHLINLSSDLLDTPDFYWEHDDLEHVYQDAVAYFSIGRRTRVSEVKNGQVASNGTAVSTAIWWQYATSRVTTFRWLATR